MCTSTETNRVRDFEHPNQEEWKIGRQQQSIASSIHAAPTSKQLLPQETTADSTNPLTAEEEAETNQQALTITLTRDTRKCWLSSSSGSHQASQRAAMSFFRGE